MSAWIITSCVLILAVILIRAVLGRSVSARLRYALWLVVALRLLVPAMSLQSPVSIMNVVPEQISVFRQSAPSQENTAPVQPTAITGSGAIAAPPQTTANPAPTPVNVDYRHVFCLVWLWGGVAVGIWLAVSNLSLYVRLRRSRQKRQDGISPLPEYVTESVSSPCLFGFFHPAIYLTPQAELSENAPYVTAHEYAHYRHGDNWWGLIRCVCLAVWWWNPLVWFAAVLSRRDGELACDEAAIEALGEDKRLSYGSALLNMVAVKKSVSGLGCAATSMTSGKKELKKRVNVIAAKPRVYISAIVATAILITCAAGCTFTGAKNDGGTQFDTMQLTDAKLKYFQTEFFNNTNDPQSVMHNNIANDTFDTPDEVNLYQIFYNGTGSSADAAPLTAQEKAGLGSTGDVDINRLSKAGMDAVLKENLGITLSQTKGRGLPLLHYSSETDCYYSVHGDTNYCPVEVDSGYYNEKDPDTVYLMCKAGPNKKYRYITLKKSGNTYLFASNQLALPEFLEVTGLTNDLNGTGVSGISALKLDYADENVIVFHGGIGLFVYDIAKGKIIYSLDFNSALGTNVLDGDVSAGVNVSADGSNVEAYLKCSEADGVRLCLHPETAYYIFTGYGKDDDIPRYSILQKGEQKYEVGSSGGIKEKATPPACMFSGANLSELTLSVNDASYKLFEGWDFAAVSIDTEYYGITADMLQMKADVDFKSLSLAALGAFYLNSDGAGAEGSGDEFYNRFMANSQEVLVYLQSLPDATARAELCRNLAWVNVNWYDNDPGFTELLEKNKKYISDKNMRQIIALIETEHAAALKNS